MVFLPIQEMGTIAMSMNGSFGKNPFSSILIILVSVSATLVTCSKESGLVLCGRERGGPADGLVRPPDSGPVSSVRVELPYGTDSVARQASIILERVITERCPAQVATAADAALLIKLAVEPGIGDEGYEIVGGGNGSVRIIGNDERGLIYGVGKFVHTSGYDQRGFTPGTWRGRSVPQCLIRGIYFATHFDNYYEAAPPEKVRRYLEDLALWGTNACLVFFPYSPYQGFEDPAAREAIQRLNRIMGDAKAVGMRVGLIIQANEGFASTPVDLKSTRCLSCSRRPSFVCPAKPAAMELLKRNWTQLLDEFAEVGLDYVVYWPYDDGGCGCLDCAPWGGRGFPGLCRELTGVLRAKQPDTRVILSTWLFDQDPNPPKQYLISVAFRKDGDYAGLSGHLATDRSWVDYLMTDAHEDFPEYPLKVGVPGGLPMINFPEITMYGSQYQWGGYGANPLPRRFQRLWDQARDKLVGGFPYSEGIFEDINKIVFSQFYWAPGRSSAETVKEYIAYEYSPTVVDAVAKAIDILEHNFMRRLVTEKRVHPPHGRRPGISTLSNGSRIEFLNPDRSSLDETGRLRLGHSSEEALRLMKQAEKMLPPYAKASWRWRILYLRALIDRELVLTDGWLEGPVLKEAFDELTRIYHSADIDHKLQVPWIDIPKGNN